jgi:hypothetical protein
MNIKYIGYIDLEGRFRCWGWCRAALKAGRTRFEVNSVYLDGANGLIRKDSTLAELTSGIDKLVARSCLDQL